MGGRAEGYEYNYRLLMDDAIIPLYDVTLFPGAKSFLFEIRTNFVLKRRNDEDEIINSERFDVCIAEFDGTIALGFCVRYRLEDYWMTDDEIGWFANEAFGFAKKIVDDDPLHASLRIVPVVVDLEVCTVQQENETPSATMERSISAEKLVPLYLTPHTTVGNKRPPFDSVNFNLMVIMPKIRVETVNDGLALMQVCRICSKNPSTGVQISVLRCHHAFHSHCLVGSLEKSLLCPVCRSVALPLE